MELHVGHDAGRPALLGQLTRFVEVAGTLSDLELLGASRCHGWAALDVVVHVRTGLQEMIGGVVASSEAAPDMGATTSSEAGAVELAVHHLDLGDVRVGPAGPALRLARQTVESLVGAALPAAWSDERCLLLGAGRSSLPPAERTELGVLAARLPALG